MFSIIEITEYNYTNGKEAVLVLESHFDIILRDFLCRAAFLLGQDIDKGLVSHKGLLLVSPRHAVARQLQGKCLTGLYSALPNLLFPFYA